MSRFSNCLTIGILTLPFLWLFFQFDLSLHSDHAWLLEAATRLLEGGSMSLDFFDPNPPLSILLYVPSAVLISSGLIPASFAHYTFTLFIVILATFALNFLLKRFEGLEASIRFSFVFAFICANTILTSAHEFNFGQRDQFIFMGLVLLSIQQYQITQGRVIGVFDTILLALSTIFILLKPHYLLIPFLFLLHRLWATKQVKESVFKPDIVVISATSVLYAFIIWMFFQDYLFEIFPVFYAVYLNEINPQTMQIGFIYLGLILASLLLSIIIGLPSEKMKAPLLCFGLALICCLLFWVQMKGIYYQLIPALGFWVCGLALLFINFGKHYFDSNKFLAPIALVAILLCALAIQPQSKAPTHQNYKDMEIVQTLQECKTDNCSFFMFGPSMDTIHQLTFYSDVKHASRFPVLWWLPFALDNPDQPLANKLKNMVSEDLEKYQPNYLIIAKDLKIDGKPFAFTNFFSNSLENYQLRQNSTKINDFAYDIFDRKTQ